VIRIETTEFYRPKSHNSEGDVRVDPELMEVFRGFFARRKGDFVIESDSRPPALMRRMAFIAAMATCGRCSAGFALKV
jgi:hypothetical protein